MNLLRILYLLYLLYAAKLAFKVVANFQEKKIPEAFKNRRWTYLLRGIGASLLWPLALGSPKGRRLLSDEWHKNNDE
ncbi:MAG: hypothetical protein R3B54_02595 [Bdellovibrionota bacterium]